MRDGLRRKKASRTKSMIRDAFRIYALLLFRVQSSFLGIEMPAGVDQFISATDKDFRAATTLRHAFSVRFDFISVGRVNDDGAAVYLHFGFREFQSQQFPAVAGEAQGAGEDRRPV